MFDNGEQMASATANLKAETARKAIAARGRFTVALSGGSTVRRTFELLAAEKGIDWSKVFVWSVDDRFVEPTNPYSNYGLIKSSLLDLQPDLPGHHFFAIPYKEATPTAGAAAYAQAMKDFFQLGDGELPRFDLIQLGMGPDGHTASLFPNLGAVTVTDKLVVASHAGLAPWVDRLTITLPVINNARLVLFIATGENKAERMREVLEGEPDPSRLPSSGVAPESGEVVWMLDKGIASKLDASTLAGGSEA